MHLDDKPNILVVAFYPEDSKSTCYSGVLHGCICFLLEGEGDCCQEL
jgi:hypothetical protein